MKDKSSNVVTGNTAFTKPENRAFYPALDGLRAVAFLLVFLHHYCAFPWGWAGVNIFFVLSGFLITGILYDSRKDPHRARNFYIRRALRIFPLYYGILILFLLFDPIAHWRLSGYWIAWPLYVGNVLPFLSNRVLIDGSSLQIAAWAWLKHPNSDTRLYLGHFWSLCVEEQFYFIWPWFVFSLKSRRKLIWVCVITVTIVPVLRLFAHHTVPPWMNQVDLLNRATPFQLDSLLLGGLLALLLRGPRAQLLLKTGKIVSSAISLVVLPYLLWILIARFPDWSLYALPDWKFTWGLTIINLFAACLIILCIDPSTVLYRLLCFSPLRWLGRISYGAYIFHDIFREFYYGVVISVGSRVSYVARHDIFFTALFALTCTVLLSWLSFEYFESAFLNLKERWTTQQPGRTLQTVSSSQ